jgi:hypothetical protein
MNETSGVRTIPRPAIATLERDRPTKVGLVAGLTFVVYGPFSAHTGLNSLVRTWVLGAMLPASTSAAADPRQNARP